MKVFKFTVGPAFISIPSDTRWQVANCVAVVIASDVVEARALLRANLAAHDDVPWDEVATVTEFDLAPAVVSVVQL